MPPFSPELPPLAQIAKEAGDVVRAMQDDIVHTHDWQIKEDGSRVTPADLKAHEIITQRLAALFPDIPVVSEEGTKESIAAALKANERFESDPLDNTKGYTAGKDGYSVNIGRIRDGRPVEGAVYFPAKDELYYTSADGKTAYVQKGNAPPKQIGVRKLPLRDPVEVVAGFSETHLEHLGGRAFHKSSEPGQYRTCKVADGTYDVTGISKGVGGYNSWDIAGPHAVLVAAGGDFVTPDGRPLEYTNHYKVPDHIAGGLDTLAALGLLRKDVVQSRKGTGIA